MTRSRPDPFGVDRIRTWLAAGAELRVCPDREMAYVRSFDFAAIITWPEAADILAAGDTFCCGERGPFDRHRLKTRAPHREMVL